MNIEREYVKICVLYGLSNLHCGDMMKKKRVNWSIFTDSRLTSLLLLIILLVQLSPSISSDALSPAVLTSSETPIASDVFEGIAEYLGANITVTTSEDQFNGYTMFTLYKKVLETEEVSFKYLVIDMEGNVIKCHDAGSSGRFSSMPLEWINSTTILTADSESVLLWNYYTDAIQHLNISGHHELEYNHNSNTIFTFNSYIRVIRNTKYLFDTIDEFDLNGSLVWSLDTRSFVSYKWVSSQDIEVESIDVTHSNTIYYDEDEDMIYYMSRNTDTFWKIDHATKEIIWGLGKHGDFALYRQDGTPKSSLFSHPHAVEKVDNNTFILFDNDAKNETQPSSRNSKMMEIVINESEMTARVNWTWAGGGEYWSNQYGDADRLPNLHRFGTFGTYSHYGGDYGPRLVEVDDSGNIVWQLDFEYNPGILYRIYRAERFRFEPIIQAPELIYSNENPVLVSWSTWYNYRPKRSILGEYWLYLDESLVDSGSLIFDRYWRPTEILTSLNSLKNGEHNLTLVLSDGFGKSGIGSLTLAFGFYVTRYGQTITEIGSPAAHLDWKIVNREMVWGNITVNGSLYNDFIWSGENIVLDAASLGVGSYQILFSLYNGSGLIFNDSVVYVIQERQAPIFLTAVNSLSGRWNESIVLDLSVSDISPSHWTILINGTMYQSEEWTFSPFNISWKLPVLDEGYYSLEVCLFDMTNLTATQSIQVQILPASFIFFEDVPNNDQIQWGTDNVSFSWTVHGISSWKLSRNGTILQSGNDVVHIVYTINDWRAQDWYLGTFTLKMEVWNQTTSRFHDISVRIYYEYGDPYADAVDTLDSFWYMDGENALGAPDGLCATIFRDYGLGYITLDMGVGEEIVDGPGDDFNIIAGGAPYRLSLNSLNSSEFAMIIVLSGNQSIDLSDFGMASVRYVRFEMWTDANVYIDAIVAKNYLNTTRDSDAPIISNIDVFGDPLINSQITIIWNCSDVNPWNYTVYLDGISQNNSPWYGTNIEYTFTYTSILSHNVTIILQDLFGNRIVSTTVIPSSPLPISMIAIGVTGISLLIIIIILKRRKSK